MWKKIINAIIGALLLIFIVSTGVQTCRVTTLSESVDRYRSDLADARRANNRYADIYRQARETNTKLGNCLSTHISTLSQLREQLQSVRAEYEEMQKVFESLAGADDLNGCGSDGGDPL